MQQEQTAKVAEFVLAVSGEVFEGPGRWRSRRGLGIEFAPKTSPAEVPDLFYAMARWHGPIFLHLRRPGTGVIESLQEVIA